MTPDMPAAGAQTFDWADGSVVEFQAQQYSGTLGQTVINWNLGAPWNLDNLAMRPRTQTLAHVEYHWSRYTRTQGDQAMTETYSTEGLLITEEQTGDEGTYDPATGRIAWNNQPTWTKAGHAPQITGQYLTFQQDSGYNVLYLHAQGGMVGLNSRGPGRASTCIAKIPLDARAPVNHVSIQRPHRWVAQCPGTLSNITFTLQDAFGNVHRLLDFGQHISFVLTWAQKD